MSEEALHPIDLPGLMGIHPNGSLGPHVATFVQLAAFGDLDALRSLFDDRLTAFSNSNFTPADRMLIAMEAITFGRLVVSRGVADDVRKFAAALCTSAALFRTSGRPDLGDMLAAETLSILEQLAEVGDDVAAICSNALLRNETPAIVERVRALRMRAAAGGEPA